MIEAKDVAARMNVEPAFQEKRIIYRKKQFDENNSKNATQSAEESFTVKPQKSQGRLWLWLWGDLDVAEIINIDVRFSFVEDDACLIAVDPKAAAFITAEVSSQRIEVHQGLAQAIVHDIWGEEGGSGVGGCWVCRSRQWQDV
ncbi:hypothetical protein MRB53_004911 [Persea americana]|uniref:Uncharacterized protein n=1 Tax=Persea americana TaxID=3435 RepID=A0ACC2MC37_PERAE|nr:hypothetical protein MRB53_004911 [Persea americana]